MILINNNFIIIHLIIIMWSQIIFIMDLHQIIWSINHFLCLNKFHKIFRWMVSNQTDLYLIWMELIIITILIFKIKCIKIINFKWYRTLMDNKQCFKCKNKIEECKKWIINGLQMWQNKILKMLRFMDNSHKTMTLIICNLKNKWWITVLLLHKI